MSNVVSLPVTHHRRPGVQVGGKLVSVAEQIDDLSKGIAHLEIEPSVKVIALQSIMEAALALHRTSVTLEAAFTTPQAVSAINEVAGPQHSAG